MARNKHPEETVEKILSVSRRLFAERGYEHTTIADIVAATGMSKGAFYHHFKSKEDVYDRITDQYYESKDWMRDATKFPGRNALEKMRGLFGFLLSDPAKQSASSSTQGWYCWPWSPPCGTPPLLSRC